MEVPRLWRLGKELTQLSGWIDQNGTPHLDRNNKQSLPNRKQTKLPPDSGSSSLIYISASKEGTFAK